MPAAGEIEDFQKSDVRRNDRVGQTLGRDDRWAGLRPFSEWDFDRDVTTVLASDIRDTQPVCIPDPEPGHRRRHIRRSVNSEQQIARSNTSDMCGPVLEDVQEEPLLVAILRFEAAKGSVDRMLR